MRPTTEHDPARDSIAHFIGERICFCADGGKDGDDNVIIGQTTRIGNSLPVGCMCMARRAH